MIQISIKSNVERAMRDLTATQMRQLPFALAHALTMTAKRAQVDEIHEMKDVFDRPTPYALGGTYVKTATKNDLTAWVYVKGDPSGSGTPADRFLLPEVKGGERKLKRFEIALRSVGALPEGAFAVPGSGAKIDAYGNMDRGQIIQILSYFKAYPEAGYKANITDKRRAKLAKGSKRKLGYTYFVGRPADGRLPLGIYQRFAFATGSAIKPIIIFVNAAHYRPILPFDYVVQHAVERDFDRQLKASLEMALTTAR